MYVYGPLEFNCSFAGDYTLEIIDGQGNSVTGYEICDEKGESKNISGEQGDITFYIKLPAEKCEKGISQIKLTTTKSDVEIIHYVKRSQGLYSYPGLQDVVSDYYFTDKEWDVENPKSKTKSIVWTKINGFLDIIKQDKDNQDKQIPNVEIKVERIGSDWEKTVTTDENGKVRIENIEEGTYRITELANENYGYRAEAQGEVTMYSGAVLKYELINEKHTGNLTLMKEDEASGKPIEGFGFKLKSLDGDLEGNNKGKYIIVLDSEGKALQTAKGTTYIGSLEYTDNIEEATEFVTDENGRIEIYNLIIGKYEVQETSVGDKYYGYEIDPDYITWKVQTGAGEETQEGETATVEVVERESYNTEEYDTANNPLRTEESSDEISTKVYPVNEKKYVKLSGYVWVDKPDGKTSQRNDMYNNTQTNEEGETLHDTQDLLFNGIEVKLKDRRTNEIVKDKDGNEMKKMTDKLDLYTDIGNNGNGEYIFEDVLIRELPYYYIEFEYDGLTYTNVAYPNSDEINQYNDDENKRERSKNEQYDEEKAKRTSKSAEGEERRTEFNESFSIIKGKEGQSGQEEQTGIRVNANSGEEKDDLTYKIETTGGSDQTAEHAIATLIRQEAIIDEENRVITLDRQQYPEIQYPIQADTSITEYNIERNYDYQPETSEIRFINLGLYEREQPDIGIAKDIYNVKVAVNGKGHTYDYAQRFYNNGFTSDFLQNYEGERYNYNEETGEYEPAEDGKYIKYQSIYSDEEEYVPVSQLIFNVGVRYGIKQIANTEELAYTKMTYRRPIYRSDYEYETEDDNELKVYITYKIKMNIAEGNLLAKINELVDYYDARYEKSEVKAGTKLNDEGNPIDDIQTIENENYNEKYNKVIFDTSSIGMIGGQTDLENDEGCIYVQFKLTRQAVADILEDESYDENDDKDLLNNVVEVNSYSIYDKEEKVYAGIDKNSNPGNTDPEDQKTYENDTDSSPALKLTPADAREITGKVFEDSIVNPNTSEISNTNDIMSGYERLGNGKYDGDEQTEPGIGGVEVTLTENKEGGKVYKTQTISDVDESGKYGFVKEEVQDDNGNVIEVFKPEKYNASSQYAYTYDKENYKGVNLEKGDFFIAGYIPGDYTLTYTWGDNTYTIQQSNKYTVQDYKGTIYDKARYDSIVGTPDKKWWHVDKINADGTVKQDGEYEVNRLTDAIDNYDTDQEPEKGSRKQIDNEMKSVNTAQEPAQRTKMDSETPIMDVSVEYDDKVYSASRGTKYTYQIDNIDFGIVERPRQQLDISKAVTAVKITLANGQVLVDAKVEDGSLEGLTGGLTYGPPSDNSNGFVKAEIDSELIQGATVEIEYTIKVENKGEIDYDCKDYYLHGTHKEESEIVKVKPQVYDYLDSAMNLDDENNPDAWTEKSKEIYKTETSSTDTIIESYFKDGKTTQPDGTEVYTWETSQSSYKELFTTWKTMLTSEKTIRDVKLDSKTILYTEKLEKELSPKDDPLEAKLYSTKLLSNAEEIDLNNDTEITEITRTTTTGTIPKIITTHTYDRGESVIITPPTGQDQNYMMPVIIGVTALVILGAGVVIIKKKVL